jgi:FlaA1/EpsC-like NDP-sugar epimerase
MNSMLKLIGRESLLFEKDIQYYESYLTENISSSRFLVIGGAGSIGQAVTKEIFKRQPLALHVIDISENNLVELVRDLRSTIGYIKGDFRTFAIDCGSHAFDALMQSNKTGYDYVLNLSALKHVRSEKDPFTLMRLIEVNILNTISTINLAKNNNAIKYFCVSTDKAANPVNMMGASKRIMEMFLMKASLELKVSTARFANVAFSDGSLLHGFNQRVAKHQPISAPNDIKRYFLTPQESGELCLMSCMLGQNRDIFFPKMSEILHLTTFSDIAVRYLNDLGFEPYECESEDEARSRSAELISKKYWPCYFFCSDTTGEKDFEEFYTHDELLDLSTFDGVGIIKNAANFDDKKLNFFLESIESMRLRSQWNKIEIVNIFKIIIPDFAHFETGKYLDERM